MVKLTFYGGVDEIGGNKILLEDKDARIFLDFGIGFSQESKFFSDYIQPRKYHGLGDFMEFGLIPDLKGIYRTDLLKRMGRSQESIGYDAVLLSHAHADHASYISHLREDLPIYCSKETYRILKVLNDTSFGTFNDLTELTRCFETYTNKRGELSRKTTVTHEDLKVPRTFQIFECGKPFRIKHIVIEPYRVDHSLAGATAYIIHTSSGTIVYTGDFRFHGRRAQETTTFMEACQRQKPDLLITEGTRIQETNSRNEQDVENEIFSLAAKTKGLTVCNWSLRDTDRMFSFLNATKKMGKKLAISTKQAYLLHSLSDCNDPAVPKIEDKDIKVYAERKSWGLIGTATETKLRNQDYDTWERAYLDDAICYKDVKEHQKDYIIYSSNSELSKLIDIAPANGSIYIKSVCEPFDVEMEMEWERIQSWVHHFGLDIISTHVSGHASGNELRDFISTVDPKKIIPIHTESSALFKDHFGAKALLVKTGKPFEVF